MKEQDKAKMKVLLKAENDFYRNARTITPDPQVRYEIIINFEKAKK